MKRRLGQMAENDYKVLGIDPGTNILGYALIEISGQTLRVIDIGVIHLKKFGDHKTRLREIFLQLQEIIEAHLPSQLAIEAPFYGKNVQSMLKLGRAQGVAIAAGITMGLDISEYSPRKVKQAVTGNGNASKEQVAAMLTHLFGPGANGHALDATDALAVAYCHFQQKRSPLAGKKGGSWKQFISDNPDRVT